MLGNYTKFARCLLLPLLPNISPFLAFEVKAIHQTRKQDPDSSRAKPSRQQRAPGKTSRIERFRSVQFPSKFGRKRGRLILPVTDREMDQMETDSLEQKASLSEESHFFMSSHISLMSSLGGYLSLPPRLPHTEMWWSGPSLGVERGTFKQIVLIGN